MSLLFLLLTLGVLNAAPAAKPGLAPSVPAVGGRVAELISQLGSRKFKERSAAAQALEEIGQPALESLRKATQAVDPEVSRRAELLARQIQKRVETTKILEPKRVHLTYDDVPLTEAVADFASKTGFTIQLRSRASDQRITLDTGETSFWQAFDQFCQKTGLIEHIPAQLSGADVRVMNGRIGGRGQVIIMAPSSDGSAASRSESRLLLTPGKPPLWPTHYAGAVRIRAVKPNPQLWTHGKDELLAVLQVSPQPKLGWLGTLDVRVDRAVDEQDQSLFSAPVNTTDGADARVLANGFVVMDTTQSNPVIVDPRETAVRLKAGEKVSKVLKDFRGAVAAQVQTPQQQLITIDNVLKAAGQSSKSIDGDVLKVLEVTRQADGAVKLKVHLQGASWPGPAWPMNRRAVLRANRIIMRNNVVVRNGLVREVGGTAEPNFLLTDSQKKGFQLLEANYNNVFTASGLAQEISLLFRPRPGQEEAAQLVYANCRTVVIEVPFSLKDVPLQ
jgi:hypothetical protein